MSYIPRSSSRVKTVNHLAAELESKLAITDPQVKGKARAKAPSNEERLSRVMRSVNAISKNLTTAIENNRSPTTRLDEWAASARSALAELRTLRPKEIDVERAASSIVRKLIALEMDGPAAQCLQDMHQPLTRLYNHANPTVPEVKLTRFVVLPLPSEAIQLSDIVLDLVATFFLHQAILCCRSHTNLTRFVAALEDSSVPSLLDWTPYLAQLPPKQHDSLFTRIYTAIATISSPSDLNADQILTLRTFGLLSLLCARPGVTAPDAFWDQASKWIRVTVQLGNVTVKMVLQTCDKLTTAARNREDGDAFTRGRGFAKFCDYWAVWAKEAGDLNALDNISSFTKCTGSSSTCTAPPGNSERGDVAVFEVTMVSTGLAQAEILFNQWQHCSDGDRTTRLHAARVAVKSCASVLHLRSLNEAGQSPARGDVDRSRDLDKVKRALERLRRSLVTILECKSRDNDTHPEDARQAARSLLEDIADILIEIAAADGAEADIDVLSSVTDSLLVLARTALVVREPTSYDVTWNTLQRAKSVLQHYLEARCAISRSEAPLDTPEQSQTSVGSDLPLANLLRCISGAFHNSAGTLYQADRISHAVRFLTEGCELGAQVWKMYQSSLSRELSPKDRYTDGWKQLQEQFWRRWEILAVCHAKLGNRRLAYDGFVECLKTSPIMQTSVAQEFATSSVTRAFAQSPLLKQFGGIIDRVTHTGACDLLLEPFMISAKRWFDPFLAAEGPISDVQDWRAVLGAILEYQVAVLSRSRWKQGVYQVLKHIVVDALDVYVAQQYPIRRARVLLAALELEYYASGDSHRPEGQVMHATLEEINYEVKSLLTCKNNGFDASLTQFRNQYLAKLSLWLVLHLHRRAKEGEYNTSAIVTRAEEARRVLELMVADVPRSSLSKASGKVVSPKVTRASSKRRAAKRTVTVAPTKLRSGLPRAEGAKLRATAPPVTPKKRPVDTISSNIGIPLRSPVASQSVAAAFDDLSDFFSLLRMTIQLLGLLGHTMPKLRMLIIAKKLTARYVGPDSIEHVMSSVDLAHYYFTLGKADKAVTIYSHLLSVVRNGVFLSEVRALYFLRYTEALASLGRIPERFVVVASYTSSRH
ncbi:uncharacterized protein FIBRA_08727 [Fibroporia radiculosa]|uniref:Separase n=1 Tax=Fibroporia radiculosa TaxID=599839 RepID=J4I385_9APHY|nr:uncharacterized protein FIBRA_08727 [Fibroporia radiculosa]CCM06462.1 predicted protein [Fibroporia radiculosa]